MGYYFAFGECYGCKQMFSFNPDAVPSIRIDGVKQPICRNCVDRANPKRVANGLPPIVPLPGAYGVAEEGVLS